MHMIYMTLKPPIDTSTIGVTYTDHRHNIQTGDIIGFETSRNLTWMDALYGKIIQRLTGYTVNHVALAVWLGERLFIIEAIPPRVRIIELSARGDFYHVPLYRADTDEDFISKHILAHIGKKYSVLEAIRSYFTNNLRDDNGVQCVELNKHIMKQFPLGKITIPETFIPGTYLDELIWDYPVFLVNNTSDDNTLLDKVKQYANM